MTSLSIQGIIQRILGIAAMVFCVQEVSAQTFDIPDTLVQITDLSTWEALFSEDIDGDDYPDLILLGRSTAPFQGAVSWMRNNGYGGFDSAQVLATVANSFTLRKGCVTDLDGNGFKDIVFSELRDDPSGYVLNLFWIPSLGGGVFDSIRLLNPLEKLRNTNGITAGNLDGNGIPDIVVFHAFRISIFYNAGVDALSAVRRISLSGLGDGVLADLNDDGFPEVVFQRPGGVDVLANYSGDSIASTPTALALGPTSPTIDGINVIALKDLDVDGDLDIAYTADIAPLNDGLFWSANQGDGSFGASQFIGVLGYQNVKKISIEDLNSDGLPDISTDVPGRSVQVAFSTGPGLFDPPKELLADFFPFTSLDYTYADFNRDGHLDAVQSGYNYGAATTSYQLMRLMGSGFCTTVDRPGDQSHFFTASKIQLRWRSTRNAVACQIQAQNLDGSQSGKRIVYAPQQAASTIPLAAFPAGSSWTWRTACACSISPLERTAWSGYKDTFHIPAAREMQAGPVEAAPLALQISPNPASTSLRVSFEGARVGNEALVLDLQGRIQHVFALPGESDRKGSGTFDLDVSSWPEGIYFLHMPNGSTASFSVVH